MATRWQRAARWVLVLTLAAILVAGQALLPGPGARESVVAAPLAAPDNSIALQPFLSSGLSSTVFITHAGDGSGRLFVVERAGRIRVVQNGQVLSTPFLDIDPLVNSGGSEQGLLGLAFHPQFESNGRFFVFYTASGSPTGVGNNVLQEYVATPPSANVAQPTAVRTLFSLPDRETNHNGGMIAFGPNDGYLYVGTGDEGGGGDPYENAQDLSSLYGKILRLDVNNGGNPLPPGYTYSIPPDNPFAQGGGRPEVWAYGFRNPWRWSFDRQTGDLYVGDVGQGSWEEVDRLPAGQGGLNYGWDVREGAHCHEPPGGCATAGLIDPILEYSRSSNGGPCASITGGYRYRGAANPALQGIYFYADYCSGRIWKGIASSGPNGPWTAVEALDTSLMISSFGEDEAGELYVVSLGGSVFRVAQTAQIPPPTATPTPVPTPVQQVCDPRPPVGMQVSQVGPGTLEVVVTANTSTMLTANELQSIAFVRTDNARVSAGTQVSQQGSFTVPLAAGTRTTRFTVQRDQPGPMRVDLTVQDRCGAWPTFVGAGTAIP